MDASQTFSMSNAAASQPNNAMRRFIVYAGDDGTESVEELPAEGLIFKNTVQMLHALVSGRLGEKVTQTMASHACMAMSINAGNQLKMTRRPEVSDALSCIKGMTPDELHALSSEAYKELCLRAAPTR